MTATTPTFPSPTLVGRAGDDRDTLRRVRRWRRNTAGRARLLVPHLYFWKSAKWVKGPALHRAQRGGLSGELRGYHLYGDPWREAALYRRSMTADSGVDAIRVDAIAAGREAIIERVSAAPRPRVVSVFLQSPLASHHAGPAYRRPAEARPMDTRPSGSYSIASAPGARSLELAIERLEKTARFRRFFFMRVASPGDAIEIRGPIGGHFVWRREDGRAPNSACCRRLRHRAADGDRSSPWRRGNRNDCAPGLLGPQLGLSWSSVTSCSTCRRAIRSSALS